MHEAQLCAIISNAFLALTDGFVGPRILVNAEQFDALLKAGLEQIGDDTLRCEAVQFKRVAG